MSVIKRLVRASDFTAADIVRLWSKIDRRGPDECWPWKAGIGKPGGYGRFQFGGRGGREIGAHVAVYAVSRGDVPVGRLVEHVECDNPPCCNPDHIDIGIDKSNARHREKKGRNGTHLHPETRARGDRNGSRLHPESRPRGDQHHARRIPECMARGDRHGSRLHPERRPRGEQHKSSKLTWERVRKMRARRASTGESYAILGRAFGVTDVAARLACLEITWREDMKIFVKGAR